MEDFPAECIAAVALAEVAVLLQGALAVLVAAASAVAAPAVNGDPNSRILSSFLKEVSRSDGGFQSK